MYQLGLIGYPIQHSLSPWIQEEFLKRANLKGNYSIYEFDPKHSFSEQINKLKQRNLRGFNVTVPFKQTIIPYLDELDSSAEKIGAVNTVLRSDDQWIGYNTDGLGYVRSLKSNFPNLFSDPMNRILIIGAGGAARGIYYSLVKAGFQQIDLANRTEQSAQEIALLKEELKKTNILTLPEAEQTLGEYKAIIQTTSVGMRPAEEASIISLEQINKDSIASDIVYQPLITRFLKQADDQGAAIHCGHTMLLYQAQYAFELWTNKQISISDMEKELKLILEGE